MELGYDQSDPISIERYAKKLIGKTFWDVYQDDINSSYSGFHGSDLETYRVQVSKGDMGNLLEEHFFHYACNGEAAPDFPEAGVELKATPFKVNMNGSISAKERLVITIINYEECVKETFETSHLGSKIDLILLVYYQQIPDEKRLDCPIKYVHLFRVPAEDLPIIKNDYQKIIDKVRAGKAHEISEGDTMYLGACTKGSTAAKSLRKQPFSDIKAKQRAFCLKQAYMTSILNHYVIPGRKMYEPILKEATDVPFEDYVINRVNKYRGRTLTSLCAEFGLTEKNKAVTASVVYRILGIKGNDAEEFTKAGIVIKTIRLQASGKIKESMSFPAFKFKQIASEEWEDDEFATYLQETKFFFVIYQFDEEGELHLKGCQFWNMPVNDIEEHVRKVWQRTKDALNEGLIIENDGKSLSCNLPKMKDDPVCHVRPHARNRQDTDELPDGRYYPKQSFWLSNKYILSQLSEEVKDTNIRDI